MKKICAVLSIFVLLILSLLPVSASAGISEDYNPNEYAYRIEKYDVMIDVDEDNLLHIQENIDVNFNEARHGIFRNIPYNFNVYREDGSNAHAKIKISNIECSDDFELSREDGEYILQIGDADKAITGGHHYTISYDYNIGMDLLDGADELYYNIIGDGWDAYIAGVTFTIHMPKEFDASKVGFSVGYYGSTGNDNVEYTVDGNTIKGLVNKRLSPNEAVTVRIELPDNYFYFDDAEQNVFIAFMIILPILCMAAVFIIWAKFGKDKKIVEVVEFYPPENMSCVDVAYWYNGSVQGSDVVPLLFELANEGYISIIEDKDGSYKIKKLKNYSGKDSAKTIFMSGLFIHGDTTYEKRLENEFYTYINRIADKYNTQEKRTKVFVGKSLWLRIACWVIIAAAVALSTLTHSAAYSTDISNYVYFGSFAVYLIAFVQSFFVRRRTDEGHEILQKIKGFKLFLETAEKERLEQLVEQSPEYFYNILPYTYVLGVSSKWVKKFEKIAIEPPEWYYGSNPYNRMATLYFINRTFNSCNKTMQSQPQSSGSASTGGNFGGGGISGGGFGGGGGGSW